VLLLINDRPDIARLAFADGVHVGQDDLSVGEARHIGGGGMLVGKSTHSIEQARQALAEGPDYIAVGPMFASKTKPDIGVQDPQLLAEVSAMTNLPIVAIGGISEANAASLKPRGPRCVAVCQSVILAADPAAAARALKKRITAE
jgi:thiamine-phosphate pyrophosphorylase